MHTNHSDLIDLMEPPSDVVTSQSNDWGKILSLFGSSLPSDYMWFINTYGNGRINNFLYVLNPFAQNESVNLTTKSMTILSSLRVIKQEFGPKEIPYPLFFEPGGLLPWGIDDNGDSFFWLTNSMNPDKWTVVIGDSKANEWEEYDTSMTSFLIELIRKSFESQILPKDFITEPSAIFIPAE